MTLLDRPLAASRIDARPSATPQADNHRRESRLLSIPVVALVAICSGLPFAWMLLQIVANPTVLVEAKLDSFRLHLLGRTLLYNGSVAVIATLLALPAAIVLGRGVGVWSLDSDGESVRDVTRLHITRDSRFPIGFVPGEFICQRICQ